VLNKESMIGVSSRSFSKSKELRERLEKNFHNIRYNEDLLHFDEDALIDFLGGCEGVIVSEDKMSKKVIDKLPALRVVSKFGVGLDGIDIDYLKKKNISLGWRPGVNSSSVAELALAYIIIMLREAYLLNREMIESKWHKVKNSRDLSDTTIGIIGYGHIGKKLASYLSPYDNKILVFDPLIEANKKISDNIRSSSLNELLMRSDAVSIHVPLTNETKNLINDNQLSMMKRGSVLVNLARGGIVNEESLYKALKAEHLSGAAFDVFEDEPNNTKEFNSNLLELKNFFSTPHIAGTSKQTIKKLGLSAIDCLLEEYQR